MFHNNLPSFDTTTSNSDSNSNPNSNSNSILSSNFIHILCFVLNISLVIALFVSSSIDLSSLSRAVTNTDTEKSANIITALDSIGTRQKEQFTNLTSAFRQWDSEIGCEMFKEKFNGLKLNETTVQTVGGDCSTIKTYHITLSPVSGYSILRNSSSSIAVAIYGQKHSQNSPSLCCQFRKQGQPLRAYIDIEASRLPSGSEDIFLSYHSSSDVQATYAGKTFRISRSYHVAPQKRDDVLVYWSSSRCLQIRDDVAKSILSLLPHHSIGKCLNNVGGSDVALDFYPDCKMDDSSVPHWWDHLHCAMSHYKFVLAIENTLTESYVTEKLFYALDSGSVPIYFSAPNVWDIVPPNSVIDASKFKNVEDLAEHVKAVAEDPIAYAEFHAWRRCGVLGNYGKVRLASLDTLPCRMCEFASRKGGRNAPA